MGGGARVDRTGAGVIYGVGTDLVEIGRVERALARFGERFAARILCPPEFERFSTHRQPAAYLAKRFAAKEAFAKALGTGIRPPVSWHGMWVINRSDGKPAFEFGALLATWLETRRVGRSHLSISDEKTLASATVVLECAD